METAGASLSTGRMSNPKRWKPAAGSSRLCPCWAASPFLVINGDVWTDYPFSRLRAVKCDWAHLVMVPNPPHNPDGDFSLVSARIRDSGPQKLTFSGIGVYSPRLFTGCRPGKFSVVPLLRNAMREHLVTGETFSGWWDDIGTVERLESVRREFSSGNAH